MMKTTNKRLFTANHRNEKNRSTEADENKLYHLLFIGRISLKDYMREIKRKA